MSPRFFDQFVNSCHIFTSCGGIAALFFKLHAARLEQARQTGQRRGQHADCPLQRADDHAEDAPAQHIGRRQAGQLLDLFRVDAPVAQQGRLQDERAIDARVVLQRLGRGDRVGAEGDRRRPDQVGDDAGAPGAFGGEARQRVLGDDVLDARRAAADRAGPADRPRSGRGTRSASRSRHCRVVRPACRWPSSSRRGRGLDSWP